MPIYGIGVKGNIDTAMKKPPQKRCYNCAHASKAFKVLGNTHHHCLEPERLKVSTTAWDTLQEFYATCQKWKAKPLTPPAP